MITIGDTFFPLIPTLFDSKLCNFYYSGSNIIIETEALYKARVTANYRVPGAIVAFLSPKVGYTLQASYPLSSFAGILSNFDFKYYTFKGGVADVDFVELILADVSQLVLKDGDKVLSDNNFTDNYKNKLDSLEKNVYWFKLPAASTVAGRCAAAVEGTDYPTGWTLSADTSPVDLLIVHDLGRRCASVTIFSVDGTTEQQLFGNAAYSSIYNLDSANQIRISALATIETQIVIHLLFS